MILSRARFNIGRMQTITRPFRARLALACAAFLGFGLCLSCLSVMERRMGLIGKEKRLWHARPPVSIPEIDRNLSGIAWNRDSGTFFAITNSPQAIFELTAKGKVLRRIHLQGFSDTEDITHIKGERFALVEERSGLIRLISITDETETIFAAASPSIDLNSRHEDNKGFESLYLDRSLGVFLTMRELPPFELLTIPLNEDGTPDNIRSQTLPLSVKDVAALARDDRGSLWILSEASSCLVRLDHEHRQGQRFDLREGGHRFQPEGLAFGPEGRLFVVGEPNILAVYLPPDH